MHYSNRNFTIVQFVLSIDEGTVPRNRNFDTEIFMKSDIVIRIQIRKFWCPDPVNINPDIRQPLLYLPRIDAGITDAEGKGVC